MRGGQKRTPWFERMGPLNTEWWRWGFAVIYMSLQAVFVYALLTR